MKHFFIAIIAINFLAISGCSPASTQNNNQTNNGYQQLRKTLLDSLSEFKATVGISVLEIETGDTLSINGSGAFATQSVYKFPLAIVVLNKVEKGELSLKQNVSLNKSLLKQYAWSPLKKQNPKSEFQITIDSLVMYMIAYSDNISCDRLFELIGGTKVADNFVHQRGLNDMHITYTEAEMGREVNRMYKNSSTPTAMTALLRDFFQGKILNNNNTQYLLNYMINDSTSHKRLLGKLPAGIRVAHKTGTGPANDSLVSACNDIGIIYLPNGKHLAITFFVMNSKESYEATENLIATLTNEIYKEFRAKH